MEGKIKIEDRYWEVHVNGNGLKKKTLFLKGGEYDIKREIPGLGYLITVGRTSRDRVETYTVVRTLT